jgi:hypothetical protein
MHPAQSRFLVYSKLLLLLATVFGSLHAAPATVTPTRANAGVSRSSESAPAATLIGRGSSDWRYLDNGVEPPAGWRSVEFDDAQWQQGRAPLGYGQRGLATEIGFGDKPAAKHLTTYFRRGFEVAELPAGAELAVFLQVDDGAILYLNGREIVRENLPAGVITRRTTATRRIEGAEEGVYRAYLVPAAELRVGHNVLAAEVHQFNGASSDLVFDVELAAGDAVQPARVALAAARDAAAKARDAMRTARVTAAAREVTMLYRTNHYISAAVLIPDGYVDGGRGMRIAPDGTVESSREVLVVDRTRDPVLRRHLEHARSPEMMRLPPLERARALALYVDERFSPAAGRNQSVQACSLILGPYTGKEVLLGDIVKCGVCRHRSLLFKLLADEAGLSVALVRGNLGSEKSAGGHAWNELMLDDGQKRIVDVMNPRPNFVFPKTTERAAEAYRTVRNEPYYAKPASARVEANSPARTIVTAGSGN